MSDSNTAKVLPLFLKHSDMEEDVAPFTVCQAIARMVGETKLVGVQRINNLWWILVSDNDARLRLYTRQNILIEGKEVHLYDENPYTLNDGIRNIQGKKADKLTIKGVPMDIDNSEIKKMLLDHGIKLISPIRDGRIWNLEGQLTEYKSGDRFVYVEPFDPPIQRRQRVGNHPCTVIHHGKAAPCIACGKCGHSIGDPKCPAKPKRGEQIEPFRGYKNPLSNHYPFELFTFGDVFKSLEHAFFWRMATEMGEQDLARKIKHAKHAGIVKRLSKDIATDEQRHQWEERNEDVMAELLENKADQCKEFKAALFEHRHKILAESTPSLFWGTGLSEFRTYNTAPNYWPGQNKLGALMMDLTQKLMDTENQGSHREEEDPEDTESVTNTDENSVNDLAKNEEQPSTETLEPKTSTTTHSMKPSKTDNTGKKATSQPSKSHNKNNTSCQKQLKSPNGHKSRDTQRSHGQRLQRGTSSPGRQRRWNSQEPQKTEPNIQQDIREAFKRKEMESSPTNETKSSEKHRRKEH